MPNLKLTPNPFVKLRKQRIKSLFFLTLEAAAFLSCFYVHFKSFTKSEMPITHRTNFVAATTNRRTQLSNKNVNKNVNHKLTWAAPFVRSPLCSLAATGLCPTRPSCGPRRLFRHGWACEEEKQRKITPTPQDQSVMPSFRTKQLCKLENNRPLTPG